MMLERAIEAAFMRGMKKLGVEALKLNLQGNRGWPDRLVLLPGRALFIEFKRPGEGPRPLQRFIHAKIEALGFEVCTYADAKEAIAYVTQRLGVRVRKKPRVSTRDV